MPPEWARSSGRRERVREALRQLEEDHAKKSVEADLARRAEEEARTGKKPHGRKPSPTARRRRKRRWANVSDPDSRLLKTEKGFVQGYNAQAAVTPAQIVVAAQVANQSNDQDQFEPMIVAAQYKLAAAGVDDPIDSVVADAGYWSHRNAALDLGPEIVIATGKRKKLTDLDPPRVPRLGRRDHRPHRAGRARRDHRYPSGQGAGVHFDVDLDPPQALSPAEPSPLVLMQLKLASEYGRRLYAQRAATVEPVFAQTKHVRGFRRFARRGLAACDSEWKLIHMTHNLLRLWRHAIPAPAG